MIGLICADVIGKGFHRHPAPIAVKTKGESKQAADQELPGLTGNASQDFVLTEIVIPEKGSRGDVRDQGLVGV